MLAAALVLAACGGSNASGEERDTLEVFAAASLTDAFEELGTRFEAQNPGAQVRFNFAASSTLAVQIRQGAPADVFASADEEQMEEVRSAGLVGEPRIFATNRLAVIVPEDNPADVRSLEDLADPDLRLVLAEEGVPVAGYAAEILSKAGERYGEDFEERVLSNLVSREVDVRAAANRVALGDADATFVYTSDVTPDIRDRVEEVEVPADLNVVATYPIATAAEPQNPELAEAWVELVLSEEGQDVLREWGFGPAEG